MKRTNGDILKTSHVLAFGLRGATTREVVRAFSRVMLTLCALLVLVGCADCDRSGCSATLRVNKPEKVTQGLVGVVASQRDSSVAGVEGGCVECPLRDARILIWGGGSAVRTASEWATLCGEGAADFVVTAKGAYEVDLEVGEYLACVRDLVGICVTIRIGLDEVTVVNILETMGEPEFHIWVGGEPIDSSGVTVNVTCNLGD